MAVYDDLLNYMCNPELLKDKGTNFALSLEEYVAVPLTSAQILALNATPVDLIAAPGTGKYLDIKKIIVELTRTATQYASGGVVTVQYSGGAVVHDSSIPAAVINGAAGVVLTALNPSSAANGVTIPTNTKVTISNATGAFTTGTGTAIVKIWYKTIVAG